MNKVNCIEDLRDLARRRVPRMFYDYMDSGSWSESSSRANIADLSTLLLRQRVGIDIAERSTRSTMLDQPVRMPVALAPAGLTGMQRADGEILAARAAARFGVPYVLSTMSICSIEDVAASTDQPFWFQLYLLRDRRFVEHLLDRAIAAQCPVLILTMDLPVMGRRHKDIRNGLKVPIQSSMAGMLGLMSKPGWCLNMLRTPRRSFGNIIGHTTEVTDLQSLAAWTAQQIDPSITWDDVLWLRRRWKGKLVLKGIMDAEDAKTAATQGVDGIIVSNHGGRQLDGTSSSARALQNVVEAVSGKLEVHVDGGIRCGQDVLRMLALGADAVYIGRPYLYGLGAMGESGVLRCLEIIESELDLTMAFCGVQRLDSGTTDVLLNKFS